ncbi:MAG: hypothetical protein LQ347_000239 [Umbilicaria vellea]|nr:MAG: hypothetical protein LQ347_000239 [Umbilicaria vellea]
MDTTAYLTRQGWLGAGHSLQPGGRGIKRPLLVSQKPNALGLGKKQHDSHADQWWARAFDSSLKSLAVDTDRATRAHHVTVGGSGALEMVQNGRGKWVGKHGLYGNFVRGEGLSGTLTPKDRVKEAVTAREGGLKGEKREVPREGCEEDLNPATLPKKRRKTRKDSDAHGSIVDWGEGKDANTNIRSGCRSEEDRRRRRRERREVAKHGGIQCAIVTGHSAASPAEGTRTRKRSTKGKVAETHPAPFYGDSKAIVEVRGNNKDADSLTVTLPNSLVEEFEEKRRKEERKESVQVQSGRQQRAYTIAARGQGQGQTKRRRGR